MGEVGEFDELIWWCLKIKIYKWLVVLFGLLGIRSDCICPLMSNHGESHVPVPSTIYVSK